MSQEPPSEESISSVFEQHLVCSNCHTTTHRIDPEEALRQAQIRNHRRRFIRLHGTNQYTLFIDALETLSGQISRGQKTDFVVCQCPSCYQLEGMSTQQFVGFIKKIQKTGNWRANTRVYLGHKGFRICED